MNLLQEVNETINSGSLIGRADLSDEQMVEAIRTRLSASGQDAAMAEAIVEAARFGDAKAAALMNTIVVPPPVSKLNMPTQRLTRGGRNRFGVAYDRLSMLVRG